MKDNYLKIRGLELRASHWLSLILLIGAAVRIFAAFGAGLEWYSSDTHSYYEQADHILSGKPISGFPNGYPIIVSLIKAIFPAYLTEYVNILINIFLSTTYALFCYLIAKDINGIKTGLLSCLFVSMYPNQINYVRQLLSEVPATFFLVLSILLLVNRKNMWAGLASVAASATRTSLLPFIPLVVLTELFERNIKLSLRYIVGVLTGILLYSTLFVGGFVKKSSNLEINLERAVNGYQMSDSCGDVKPNNKMSINGVYEYANFAAENPALYMRQRMCSLWGLWGPIPSKGGEHAHRNPIERLLIGLRFPLLLFGIISLTIYPKKRDVWILLLPVLTVTSVHLFFFSTPRFTYPAEPGLLILASLVLAWFGKQPTV